MAKRKKTNTGLSPYDKSGKPTMLMPKSFAGKSTKLGGGGRFAMVEAEAAAGGAKNPAAVAAVAGRKKYGAKKMAAMAKAGKKRTGRKT